jgi:KDO2-lipid IV(A) lauroyltransferase
VKLIVSRSSGRALALSAWLFFAAVRLIPRSILNAMFLLIVQLIFSRGTRFRSVSVHNLKKVYPLLSEEERLNIMYGMQAMLARSLCEIFRGDCLDPDWIAERVELRYYTPRIPDLPTGRAGRIIACCHYSNFEAIAQALALNDLRLSFVARAMKSGILEWLVRAYREFHGNSVLPRSGAYKSSVRELGCGRDVGVLFDQNVTRKNALFTNFLGFSAATTRLPALLAYRTQAPIIFTYIKPKSNLDYEVVWKDLSYEVSEADYKLGRDEFVKKVTTMLNKELEHVVNQDPTQWFWMHRRWKTQPSDELETFYADLK